MPRKSTKKDNTAVSIRTQKAADGRTPKAVDAQTHNSPEQTLLDPKLFRKGPQAGILGLIVAFLILAGAGFSVYYLLWRNFSSKTADYTMPEIIVPKAEVKRDTPADSVNTEPIVVAVPSVEVGQTPTGFLNVRSGPGTNYEKVGQVKPGEAFDLVSENKEKGWYEIRISTTTVGWVTKQYAKIK